MQIFVVFFLKKSSRVFDFFIYSYKTQNEKVYSPPKKILRVLFLTNPEYEKCSFFLKFSTFLLGTQNQNILISFWKFLFIFDKPQSWKKLILIIFLTKPNNDF